MKCSEVLIDIELFFFRLILLNKTGVLQCCHFVKQLLLGIQFRNKIGILLPKYKHLRGVETQFDMFLQLLNHESF